MSKPYKQYLNMSPVQGTAGAVAQGQQGGNTLRYTPGSGPQSNADITANPYMGGNSPKPIKFQGITPATGPEFGYGVGAAGWNSGVQQQWVNQNGLWYGPNGQQLDDATYRRTVGALGGGPGSSSSSSMYASGGGNWGDYQAKYNEAKAANESRYAEGKQLYDERFNRNMGYLEGSGSTERAAINQRGTEAKAGNRQRLESLGLGATTIGASLDAGVDRDVTEQQGALNERLNNQRLAADSSMSKDKIDFIERRQDLYPEIAPYLQAAAMSSSSGSGGGGSSQYAGGSAVPLQGFGGGGLGMDFQPGPGGRGGTFVRRQQQNLPFNGTPTGVNLDYITPAALNDPSYADALRNTNMPRPPRLVNQRPYYG